jgi:deoxyribodipyrimidine photo-lyase
MIAGSQTTRAAGLTRLADFLPRAGRDYARTRNEDRGPDDRANISLLSPYLRRRLITEEEVIRTVRERHGRVASEKFVAEVLWRTYWKGWLEQHPGVWQAYLRDIASLQDRLATDAPLRDAYEAAVEGRTGIDGFDAWSRELVQSGYVHNHARMWFASIWTFTLGLPWQLGADFFYRHLIDGDPASNTLSWRWVVGLHTKGRTYAARRDNIVRYTGGRFDPGARLAQHAPPLEEPADITALVPAPAALPIPAEAVLLLHAEDLHPESLPLTRSQIRGIALLESPAGGRASSTLAFDAQALSDAADRASAHFGVPIHRIHSGDSSAALERFACDCRVDAIVTPYAPVGTIRDALEALAHGLSPAVGFHRCLRNWDEALWPGARSGYFSFAKRAEKFLEIVPPVGA